MTTQRLRDLEHALSKVFSGDMSVEAGCVMDALTDLGWQLTPIAQTQPAPPVASTSRLPEEGVMSLPDCPNAAKHIDGPDNYVAAFEWRKEMSKTHTVSRCPDCLRFRIWTPKKASS